MWYLDAQTGALRHAWWEDFTWRSEIVDGPKATTSGATHDKLEAPLAVTTPDGLPSVLYVDRHSGAIRQATWAGGGWHLSTVEQHAASALAAAVS